MGNILDCFGWPNLITCTLNSSEMYLTRVRDAEKEGQREMRSEIKYKKDSTHPYWIRRCRTKPQDREYRWHLKLTVSKKAGTSVLQPHGTEFGNNLREPEIGFSPRETERKEKNRAPLTSGFWPCETQSREN